MGNKKKAKQKQTNQNDRRGE